MADGVCAMCASEFTARAGAIYCSSACRQRAHRVRVARKWVVSQDRVGRRGAPAPGHADVTNLMERARRAMARSNLLRQASAGNVARAVNLQHQLGDQLLQGMPTDGR